MSTCVYVQQPSADIFFRFDQLLLLQRGGHVVFFGSCAGRARPLIDYFTEVGGSPIPPRTNPANWMLNVIGGKYLPRTGAPRDFAELYNASALKAYVPKI